MMARSVFLGGHRCSRDGPLSSGWYIISAKYKTGSFKIHSSFFKNEFYKNIKTETCMGNFENILNINPSMRLKLKILFLEWLLRKTNFAYFTRCQKCRVRECKYKTLR